MHVYFVEVEFELEFGEFGEWGGDVEDVADGVGVGVVEGSEGGAERAEVHDGEEAEVGYCVDVDRSGGEVDVACVCDRTWNCKWVRRREHVPEKSSLNTSSEWYASCRILRVSR